VFALVDRLVRQLDSRRATIALLAAFVLSRLVVLVVDVIPTSDAFWYYTKGAEIAAGMGYRMDGQPTALWPVGYSGALAAVFSVFGTSVAVAQAYNLVLATLLAWLVHATIFRSTSNRAAANLGLLVLLCYPNHAGYVALIYCEIQYALLIVLAAYIVCTRSGMLWYAALGLALGASELTKAQTLLLLPFVIGIIWYRSRELPRALWVTARASVVCVIFAAAVVLPWSLRNLSVFGSFVLVSTNGGVTLAYANNPKATGDYGDEPPWPEHLTPGIVSEVERDRSARALALEWIRENPGTFLALVPKKLWYQWAADGETEWGYQAGAPSYAGHQGTYRALRWVNQVYYMLILLWYLAALWRSRHLLTRLSPAELLGHAVVLVTTATAVIFFGSPRYHFAAMQFILISGAIHFAREYAQRSASAERASVTAPVTG
jgi:hypothetical protein